MDRWHLFQKRFKGGSFDRGAYINLIDRLCRVVYLVRFLEHTPDMDFESFRNAGWDYVETRQFQNALYRYLLIQRSDEQIERYFCKSFENLLTKKIMDRTPGLETRKKQMDRVLKADCAYSCRKWCKCWKLKDLKGQSISQLVEVEELLNASKEFQRPVMRYPKQNAKKGPAVNDHEMKDYLLSVLKKSGGMTERKTMIAFLMEKFGIVSIQEQPISNQNTDQENEQPDELSLDYLSWLVYEQSGDVTSPEHRLMAEDILRTLRRKQKIVFYQFYVLEKKQTDIAQQMQISNSQVHNIKYEIVTLLMEYFNFEEQGVSIEEFESVYHLMKIQIEREMTKQ